MSDTQSRPDTGQDTIWQFSTRMRRLPPARTTARARRIHRPPPEPGPQRPSPDGCLHLVHGLPHDPAGPGRPGGGLGVRAGGPVPSRERMADLPRHGHLSRLLQRLRHAGRHRHRTRDAKRTRPPDLATGSPVRDRARLAGVGAMGVLAQPSSARAGGYSHSATWRSSLEPREHRVRSGCSSGWRPSSCCWDIPRPSGRSHSAACSSPPSSTNGRPRASRAER